MQRDMAGKLPDKIQGALDQGALKRLPLTFLPFVNQQLSQWDYLFPNERQSVERLLLYVARLSPQESDVLFHDVVELEIRMGVRQWQFSIAEQTIQNSSQLARSPYFQEWRRAVQAVFDTADRNAQQMSGRSAGPQNRLLLLVIPQSLPVSKAEIWRRWRGIGKTLQIDLNQVNPTQGTLEFLLTGGTGGDGKKSEGLLNVARSRSTEAPADTWVIDAGHGLTEALMASHPGAVFLSNTRLDQYRQNFSHEMNTMHKDLADADAVFDRLRKVDVSAWCPLEVGTDPAVREFVRSLYLSGNGAVIFGNSFVEWASSEALRRARPTFLAAKFGVRSKPKPFTGVAVFDNPDQINPLPAVDDLEGSAIDAQMLALYVWLAATRYEEYQQSTVCVCLAESLSEVRVVAPPEFELLKETEPVSLDWLGQALRNWIAQT